MKTNIWKEKISIKKLHSSFFTAALQSGFRFQKNKAKQEGKTSAIHPSLSLAAYFQSGFRFQ
jgi:hypothetical protein